MLIVGMGGGIRDLEGATIDLLGVESTQVTNAVACTEL